MEQRQGFLQNKYIDFRQSDDITPPRTRIQSTHPNLGSEVKPKLRTGVLITSGQTITPLENGSDCMEDSIEKYKTWLQMKK